MWPIVPVLIIPRINCENCQRFLGVNDSRSNVQRLIMKLRAVIWREMRAPIKVQKGRRYVQHEKRFTNTTFNEYITSLKA